jgi:hypothetical protein
MEQIECFHFYSFPSEGKAFSVGLDNPGIKFQWERDFPHQPWGPPSRLYKGY